MSLAKDNVAEIIEMLKNRLERGAPEWFSADDVGADFNAIDGIFGRKIGVTFYNWLLAHKILDKRGRYPSVEYRLARHHAPEHEFGPSDPRSYQQLDRDLKIARQRLSMVTRLQKQIEDIDAKIAELKKERAALEAQRGAKTPEECRLEIANLVEELKVRRRSGKK